MSNHLPKVCPACGVTFFVKPSHFEIRKACSKKCQSVIYKEQAKGSGNANYKDKKRTVNCAVCKKEFSYYPSIRTGKCCSVECSNKYRSIKYVGSNNKNWRGGKEKNYGANWILHRDIARQRDNYTCQKCGVTEFELGRNLDVHHKKPFRVCSDYLEANNINNLVSLCPRCHKQEEKESVIQYGKSSFKHKIFKNIDPDWITAEQASKIIGISVWGIYTAIRRGGISAKNLHQGVKLRERPRFIIHIDEAKKYKKRYSK